MGQVPEIKTDDDDDDDGWMDGLMDSSSSLEF